MIKKSRIILSIIGMLMITFGIAFIVETSDKFGVGSFEAMCMAIEYFLQDKFNINISIGTIITIFSIVVITIAYLIAKRYKAIPFVSLALAFGFGFLTDFWIGTGIFGAITKNLPNDFVWILVMIANITVVTIGACFMIVANIGLTPLDFLVDTIAKKLNVTFGTAKIIFEVVVIALGVGLSFLVGQTGHIGLITFMLGVIIGVEIKFMLPWVKNFFTKRKII